jgi:hypothetical protein
LRFAITNGPRAAKIEWNSFPEHCFPAGQFFYVNSGGLRAGKGPATLREASRLPVYNVWWIIAATCDLAAAAPKSAPGRIQGAHGMDRTRARSQKVADFLDKIMRKNK